MRLMTWLTRPDTAELFDYAPILIRVDQLARDMHDACLHKKYDEVLPMIDEMQEQCVMLKKWIKAQ